MDGKLKSRLEWPNCIFDLVTSMICICTTSDNFVQLLVILLLKCTSFCSQALNSPCHQARLSSSLSTHPSPLGLKCSTPAITVSGLIRLSPNYALSISVILCALSASPSSLLAVDGLVHELVKIAVIWTMVRRSVLSIWSTGLDPVRVSSEYPLSLIHI